MFTKSKMPAREMMIDDYVKIGGQKYRIVDIRKKTDILLVIVFEAVNNTLESLTTLSTHPDAIMTVFNQKF